ncbi:MAG: hypothetical protein AAF921_18615 [Cyanobacteria bacterium P01_D01_bin.44]
MSERLDYVQQLETHIATTRTKLEKLKTERDEAMLAVQHEEIENLEKYLEQADVNLKGISATAEDAWHEFKAAIDQLMGDISSALRRLLGESEDSSDQ